MSANHKQPYILALDAAQRIVEALAPNCDRIEIAGSIRRQRDQIGDIEIVALPMRQTNLFGQPVQDAPTALDAFLQSKVQLLKNGPKQKQFQYGRFSVDLFLPASADHWGSILLIRTGSHDFNLWLMKRRSWDAGVAFRDGLLVSRAHGDVIATPEETDVFAALRLPAIPPHDRDGGRWVNYTGGSNV